MDLIKIEVNTLENGLKASLDRIDETVKKAAWDGYFWSRLNILLGMWEKGRAINGYFTPPKIATQVYEINEIHISWRELERQTLRHHTALKKWHDLYRKTPDRDSYLELAKEQAQRWTDRAFKKELPGGEIALPLPPKDRWAVIYADPPWSYSNSGFDESANSQYPTMPINDICKMDVASLCASQSVLFLWATNPLIPDALQVITAWGFEYKTNMAWIKDRGRGKGWFLKSKHELILIAVRNETPHPQLRPDSCFEAKRENKHSKKPHIIYEKIEAMYPGPLDNTFYLELFARNTRQGWKSWGNEI